jgi:hypothetical protein
MGCPNSKNRPKKGLCPLGVNVYTLMRKQDDLSTLGITKIIYKYTP